MSGVESQRINRETKKKEDDVIQKTKQEQRVKENRETSKKEGVKKAG